MQGTSGTLSKAKGRGIAVNGVLVAEGEIDIIVYGIRLFIIVFCTLPNCAFKLRMASR